LAEAIEPRMKTNLSAPQQELLEKIGAEPTHCVDYYTPAKKLVQLGLARFVKSMLTITDAGREKLKESQSAKQ
jgi:hypothetical protein